MTTGADWLDQARRLLDAVRGPEPVRGAPVDAGADGHPDDCRWCPVCQTAAVLRGERPEVTAALADVLTTAADVSSAAGGAPASATVRRAVAAAVSTSASAAVTSGRSPRTTAATWQTGHHRQSDECGAPPAGGGPPPPLRSASTSRCAWSIQSVPGVIRSFSRC